MINLNIYQEQTEARAKAIQQTRLQRHRQKEAREHAQLMSHLKQIANPSVVSANPASAPVYEIVVEGIRFRVTNNGSKLVKVPGAPSSSRRARVAAHPCPGDPNAPKATPKMTVIGGVKFYRSKNGNMYRQAIVKAQRYVARPGDAHTLTTVTSRRSAAVNKVNVPCRNFSNTGISLQSPPFLCTDR